MDYSKIKETLEKKKEALLARRKNRALDQVDYDGDEADQVRMDTDQKLADSLAAQELNSVVQIERCLTRIATNSYGVCEECEEQIALKRLEANPFTSVCISCAIDLESK